MTNVHAFSLRQVYNGVALDLGVDPTTIPRPNGIPVEMMPKATKMLREHQDVPVIAPRRPKPLPRTHIGYDGEVQTEFRIPAEVTNRKIAANAIHQMDAESYLDMMGEIERRIKQRAEKFPDEEPIFRASMCLKQWAAANK